MAALLFSFAAAGVKMVSYFGGSGNDAAGGAAFLANGDFVRG